jgi:hypothetical protein
MKDTLRARARFVHSGGNFAPSEKIRENRRKSEILNSRAGELAEIEEEIPDSGQSLLNEGRLF